MNPKDDNSSFNSFGSQALNELIQKLKTTENPRRRYEYVIWLGKKLPLLSEELLTENIKVEGCISEVYVKGELIDGRLSWKGYSDALITKGLLTLLIKGLNDLTPEEVLGIDNRFIEATGLQSSLTPSRANGFLNILLKMKTQAKALRESTIS